MNLDELAALWLRGMATDLREQAGRNEVAYKMDGPARRAAVYVAAAYRQAAELLDEAANNYPEASS